MTRAGKLSGTTPRRPLRDPICLILPDTACMDTQALFILASSSALANLRRCATRCQVSVNCTLTTICCPSAWLGGPHPQTALLQLSAGCSKMATRNIRCCCRPQLLYPAHYCKFLTQTRWLKWSSWCVYRSDGCGNLHSGSRAKIHLINQSCLFFFPCVYLKSVFVGWEAFLFFSARWNSPCRLVDL